MSNKLLSNRQTLRWSDWLVGVLLAAWAFAVFKNARADFSYDYANYISYLDSLARFKLTDIWSAVAALLPYPYVLIPPSALFEVGFVFPTWLLLSAGLSSATVFALVAASSIATRILLLRSLGVRWPLNAFIAVYSITLFEANAIRLGCALTLMIGGLLALLGRRRLLATSLIAAASLFHLQALAFGLPLIATYAAFGWINRSAATRSATVAVVLILASAASGALQTVEVGKISDYAGRQSAATGFNAVSLLALASLTFGAFAFIRQRQSMPDIRVWGSAFLATCPALVLLLLATNMGAVGDRIWQFAFISLLAVHPAMPKHGLSIKLYKATVWVCLAVAVLSITIRYPLSNFFSPLIPYTPINPEYLVI